MRSMSSKITWNILQINDLPKACRGHIKHLPQECLGLTSMLISCIDSAPLSPEADLTRALLVRLFTLCWKLKNKKKLKLSRVEHEQHRPTNHVILDAKKPLTLGIHVVRSNLLSQAYSIHTNHLTRECLLFTSALTSSIISASFHSGTDSSGVLLVKLFTLCWNKKKFWKNFKAE